MRGNLCYSTQCDGDVRLASLGFLYWLEARFSPLGATLGW